ncbi:MAG: hypothetical protein GXP33_14000 [Spirochaetes bacterium]|nr:hypothetical protein [Spirochaetota bacterium]
MKSRGFFYNLFSNWPAKVLSLAAAVIIFLFYRMNTMDERFFGIPLHVELPSGFAVSADYPKSVRVTLRGEGKKIYPILEEDIVAYADLRKHKSEGLYKIPVRITKKGTAAGVESLEIKVEPEEIKFTLEKIIQKRVKVVPILRGVPAHGYELTQFTVRPSMIMVQGPRTHIESIKQISTSEISLTGRIKDFTSIIRLKSSDPYVHFVDEDRVEFHASIEKAVILKTFADVDIISIDLQSGLTLAKNLPKGSIKVQGPQLLIESLKPGQFGLTVDCSEVREAGSTTLAVKPEVPDGVIVLSYEPESVVLDFVRVNNVNAADEINRGGIKRQ